MNMDTMKHYVLLAHSGELPARKKEKLKKALASSEKLRQFARELDQTAIWMKEFKTEHQPGADTLRIIHETAAGRIPRRRTARPGRYGLLVPAVQWAAAAALLLLCLIGAYLMLHEVPEDTRTAAGLPTEYLQWDTRLDEELEEFELKMVYLEENWPRASEWSSPANGHDADSGNNELMNGEGVEI